MATNARAAWIGNYMRGRAAHGPGAFERNRGLMAQASAAYARAHGGASARPGRRNPDGGRRVRSNPSGFSGGQLLMIGVGLYALVPAFRAQINSVAGQLAKAGSTATQPTTGA